jgi:hypothetical protein
MNRRLAATAVAIVAITTSAHAGFFRNVEKAVAKAVDDTNAEVKRASDKITNIAAPAAAPLTNLPPSSSPAATPPLVVPKEVALEQVKQMGQELKESRTAEAITKEENDVLSTRVFTLAGALVTALIAMVTRGLFDRYDRRDKFLAAVEREWNLDRQGFDFRRLPRYRRLSTPLYVDASIEGAAAVGE